MGDDRSSNVGRRAAVVITLLLAAAWMLAPEEPVEPGPTVAPPQRTVVPAAQPVKLPPLPPVERETVAGRVHCEATVAPGIFRVGPILEHDPETLEPIGSIHPVWNDHVFTFTPRNADGIGTLDLDGYKPVTFAWAGGDCTDLVAPESEPVALVEVTVRDLPPKPEGQTQDPLFFKYDCGKERTLVGADLDEGPWLLRLPEEGRCTLRAMFPFGGRFVVGEPFLVDAVFGEVVEAEVGLPEPEPGDAGWDLNEEDGGLRVVAVYPRWPVHRAGLRPGDLVVEVDGEAGVDLAAEDLHDTTAPRRLTWMRGDVQMEAAVP